MDDREGKKSDVIASVVINVIEALFIAINLLELLITTVFGKLFDRL
ncbi:MAG: hypothetical protein J5879_09570 [Clostridia bacterium]|nr:hypothetical protein [Clostridia bacterium]